MTKHIASHEIPPDRIADSREWAILIGLPYYEGRPCFLGHDGVRHTSNMECVDCTHAVASSLASQRVKRWKMRNHDKVIEQQRRHRSRATGKPLATGPAKGRPRSWSNVAFEDLPTSRPQALATAQRQYKGRPCPRGHAGRRYTASGQCVECNIGSKRPTMDPLLESNDPPAPNTDIEI